jgi:hypothetical protein
MAVRDVVHPSAGQLLPAGTGCDSDGGRSPVAKARGCVRVLARSEQSASN